MTYCSACGHKIGIFEKHWTLKNGSLICNGCYQKALQEEKEKAQQAALAPYERNDLPVVRVDGAIMKQGETAYAQAPTVLEEIKTVNLGYQGGSQGLSIPTGIKIGGSPIRYRVGQSRGHIVKHDELQQTSRGNLIATNQRLFLNPVAGNKPLGVPLGKIASFHVYENGLEVWQDNKAKPFLFALDSVHAEIMGLVLSKLLNLT
jgi:hypothetical protein